MKDESTNKEASISTGANLDNKYQKEPINNLNLVKKCLLEIAYLYRLSALIEIVLFLTITIIFLIFYLFEANVEEFFTRNHILKTKFFQGDNLQRVAEDFVRFDSNKRAFEIVKASLNYSSHQSPVSFRQSVHLLLVE